MRRLLPVALAACALLGLTASANAASPAAHEYVVLYEHSADAQAARLAITRAGGRIVSENADIGAATVRASKASFAGDVARSSAIVGATTNRVIGKAPRDAAKFRRDAIEKDVGAQRRREGPGASTPPPRTARTAPPIQGPGCRP